MKKEITIDEQKKILIKILAYVDNICRKNNIKYSLIGGSLIGAIRHNGFIPWDDDIDIILMPKEYKKLICALKQRNDYELLIPSESKGYYYPFAKLVDKQTVLYEYNAKHIPNYGVYIDIFQYRYISNNKILQTISYMKQSILKDMISLSMVSNTRTKEEKNILKKIAFYLARKTNTQTWLNMYLKCMNQKTSNHIVSSWPVYGKTKEIQHINDTKHYEYHIFENIDAMIFSSYDSILKTTFGNYMQLPPKEKQKTHHKMKIYRKEP